MTHQAASTMEGLRDRTKRFGEMECGVANAGNEFHDDITRVFPILDSCWMWMCLEHNSRGGVFGRVLSYIGQRLSVLRMWGTVAAHFTSR